MISIGKRGLRWIGWSITIPATALIVLALQEQTKDWVVEVPGKGVVLSGRVPAGLWDALITSKTKDEFKATLDKLPLPANTKADLREKVGGTRPTDGNLFTAHTNVNRLRLFLLILGSLVGVVVLIQGSILILTRRLCGNAARV